MKNNHFQILAIESSCDETAMAVVEAQDTESALHLKILSNVVASQIDLHKKWGGVYPELASRAHLEAIMPTLEEALSPLEDTKNKNLKLEILNCLDAIAVTAGPGLIGSLLMGVETANILGANFQKPIIPVNHLEGHIYSAFAKSALNSNFQILKNNIFPILALVVSGGHTSLILMREHLKYETVGQTIDDAAGEAFDKVARILDLGYPGGPEIEKIAKSGNEDAYKLPLSMLKSNDLNFSFSGLKTAVLYLTKNPITHELRPHNKADLSASFQKTVSEILTAKTLKAIQMYNPKTVILSGGVSANQYLRDYLSKAVLEKSGIDVLIPPRELSTDNALGIAIAGAIKFTQGARSRTLLDGKPNWKIDEI